MSYILDNYKDTHYTDANALRWNSNGRCLMSDAMEELFLADMVTEKVVLATKIARDKENAEFIEEYRKAQANRTAEEIAEQRAEARAAMGPGVDMVNIFTGETYRT